jgi:hypothetical protein
MAFTKFTAPSTTDHYFTVKCARWPGPSQGKAPGCDTGTVQEIKGEVAAHQAT